MTKLNEIRNQTAQSFRFLIELYVTMFEEETSLWYCISENSYIEVYDTLAGQFIDREGFKRTERPLKEDLREILKSYINRIRFTDGLPSYAQSTIFSEFEYNDLIDELNQEIEREKLRARENKSAIIYYSEEQGLSPTPTGTQQDHWYARCPNSIGFHTIMVSAAKNQWGCGYCCRKGNLADLETWIEEIQQKRN